MLGDLDLLHHVSRHVDSKPAVGNGLSRMSLDSNVSGASTASNASANVSSSWGGFAAAASPKSSFLMRQFSSRDRDGASAPVSIPRAAGAPAQSFRRNSVAGYFPDAATPPLQAASGPVVRCDGHRMPQLVRSLSKGLSQSMDFR